MEGFAPSFLLQTGTSSLTLSSLEAFETQNSFGSKPSCGSQSLQNRISLAHCLFLLKPDLLWQLYLN